MSRREFISLLGGAAVAWPLAANAQQADEMRRIGVLIGLAEDDPETKTRLAAFRQGLERLGVCGRLSPAVAKKRGRNFAFALVKMK